MRSLKTFSVLFFALFSGCCGYLMKRLRFNHTRNTRTLQEIGHQIGDNSIPDPTGRSGAAFVFEIVIFIIAGLALMTSAVTCAATYLESR